jgi:hypothetical protein
MREEVRQQITSLVYPSFDVDFPGVAMVTENEPFVWNAPPSEFVEFIVAFHHASQIGSSAIPKTRLSGYVYVCVRVAVGTGVSRANGLSDWFADKLGYKQVNRISLKAPEPDGSTEQAGYYLVDLKVPFHADAT